MIYENIVKIARKQNIPLNILEKKACIANGAISKWKTSNPNIDSLIAVANALNTTVSTIIGESVEYSENCEEQIETIKKDMHLHELDILSGFRFLRAYKTSETNGLTILEFVNDKKVAIKVILKNNELFLDEPYAVGFDYLPLKQEKGWLSGRITDF